MIASKQLVEGRNLIDGHSGEYIGTFYANGSFFAAFDANRNGTLDQFTLVVVPFHTPMVDYPTEYSVECFGTIGGTTYAVLMDMEN